MHTNKHKRPIEVTIKFRKQKLLFVLWESIEKIHGEDYF